MKIKPGDKFLVVEDYKQMPDCNPPKIQFKPGDRVIIPRDVWYPLNPGIIYQCDATKGSTARIMSFEEFCEYHKDHYVPFCINPDDEQLVKEAMESGSHFPIQFEYIAQLKEEDENNYAVCKIGGVLVLNAEYFVKYETEGNESLK